MCIIILILIIVVCTITFFVCSSLLSRPFSSNSTRIVRLLSKIFLSRRRFNETLMFWWLAALPDLHRLIDTTGDHIRMAFVKIYENMIVLAILSNIKYMKSFKNISGISISETPKKTIFKFKNVKYSRVELFIFEWCRLHKS